MFKVPLSPIRSYQQRKLWGNDLRISKRPKDEGGCVRTTNLNNILADQRGQNAFIHIHIYIYIYSPYIL